MESEKNKLDFKNFKNILGKYLKYRKLQIEYLILISIGTWMHFVEK
jgi:hypothetical protein